MLRVLLAATVAVVALPASALAAPAGLDAGFGNDGVTTIDFFGKQDFANGMATAPDGKIVVVGSAETGGPTLLDFAIVRLNRDGTLDQTFGSRGKRTIDFKPSGSESWADYAADVIVEPDGQIVVAGTSREPETDNRQMTITRLNADDGSTDLTFGNTSTPGHIHIPVGQNGAEARGIDRFANGSYVVAGTAYGSSFNGWNMVWAGVDQAGQENALTAEFTFTAGSTDLANDVAVTPDGKFVVAGATNATDPSYDFAAVRRTIATNGSQSQDNSFNENGRTTFGYGLEEEVSAVAVQPDNKVVTTGSVFNASEDFLVHRLTAGGLPDTSFGNPVNNGGVFIDFGGDDSASDLKLLPGGKIAVVGRAGDGVGAARLTGGGELDSSFGVGGKRTIPLPGEQDPTALAVQPDGGYLVAGNGSTGGTSNFFVMRIGRFTPRPKAPTPLTPPPVRPGLAKIAISAKALKANAKGVVGVKVTCSAAVACRGTVGLATLGKVSVSGQRRKPKRRKLTLARRSYSVPAGKTKVVKVKLRRAGLKLLRKRRRLRVRLTITTRRTGAKAAKVGRTVTLTAARKRGRRR